MATVLSYNLSLSGHGMKDNYICDCGRKCSNQTDLDQHKLNNCQIRSIECSFCQESQSSTIALRDHLMTCGNKTDQCPNCRKFIRRAVFAYHYENNCANLEENDTHINRSRRSSSKFNESALRENDIDDSSIKHKKSIEIIPSTISNKRNSLNRIECEFCNNQCTLNDYKDHKENCLRNLDNLNKPGQRSSSISKTTKSHCTSDIVNIPCEFCNDLIDICHWSTHVKDCRTREVRRIEARAETINQEPILEKLPCEHCEQLFLVEQLQTHEITCEKHRENLKRLGRHTNRSLSATIDLSDKSSKTERHSTLLSSRSSLPSNHSSRSKDIINRIDDLEYSNTLQGKRFSSLTTVNTKEIPRDNNTSTSTIRVDQTSKQRRASHHLNSTLINSSYNTSSHDTLSLFLNDRSLSDTQSLPHELRNVSSLDRTSLNRPVENGRPMPQRTPSQNISISRSQSASANSLDARGSHRTNSTKTINPTLVNGGILFYCPREEDSTHQPKLNQHDRSTMKNNKSKRGIPLLQPPMKFQ